jgi:branched-subunit amino acid transport protein
VSTSALVVTVVAAGLITFASRALFLLRPAPAFGGWVGRFLDVFPLALFVSLAVAQAVAPDGNFEMGPGIVGLAAGTVTAVFTRRIVLIMLIGWVAAVLAGLGT